MIIIPVPSARGMARRLAAERAARDRALLAGGWTCQHCGTARVPAEKLPGSDVVNFLLIAAFVFPAVKYWNWRKANRWYSCPACSRRVEPPDWYVAGAMAPPAEGTRTAGGAGFRCTRCGSTHPPATRYRGSTGLEVLLWCAWIIPGWVYRKWRRAVPGTPVCDRCGLEVGTRTAR